MSTVVSIIEQYNTERPNSVEDYMKVDFLKKIEQMIINTVIKTHMGAPDDEELEDHIESFDYNTELLVGEPYDDLYIHYLDQRIALNNNDTKRYNLASTMFNNAMLVYQQYYNREHMGIKPKGHLIRHEVL